jgi:ribonuclease E
MLESELNDREFDDNAGGGRGTGELSRPAPSVPAAVFQPPQVVFQPPPPRAEPSPRAEPAPGGEPFDSSRPDSSRPDSSRADSSRPDSSRSAGPGNGEAPGDGSADDDGAGPGRRRRRRPSRSRARSADSDAGADADDAQTAQGADEVGGPQDADGAQGQPEAKRAPRTRSRRASAAKDSADPQAGGSAERADDASPQDAAPQDGDDDADAADGPDTEGGAGRRRRRKRRRGSADSLAADPAGDDPPDTVVHVREPSPADDVRSVKGSTRLEAKKQRRREGRETGRRRPLIITESEFLARRESVERTMVVRSHHDRTQIAVLEDDVLVEHYVSRSTHQSYVGNVYLGKVQNVLPSMEAAFVDVGKGRNAVLYAGEVNFDVSGMEGQPKRIESALKAGQSLIVQVTKDPVGHKGARLTSQISLPGRYLVYVPGASMTGISRKLPDTERNRLKQILKKVMPENAGVIVRTAAEGAAEEELSRDVTRLAAQWEAIEKKSKTASSPALLYGEPDLTTRVIRDVFNEDFSNLIVAGDEEWDAVDEYVRYVAPHLIDRLSRWQEDGDVFAAYRIDEQLAKALDRKVWLPSGGSLVIDKTEAMTVIDVNTGKFTGQGGNLEETVTRNNLEAAEEIVRQLRLRDVGGIVVIDFIDMVLESNRELVLRRLLECLARDRTKHQVAEVTSLGLVQMTRKRVGAGLLEAFSVPCECCNGRGVIVTLDPEADSQAAGHVHARGGSGNGGNGSRGSGATPVNPATIAARIRSDGNGQAADTADERDPDGPGEDGAPEGTTSAAAGATDGQPEPARSGNSRRRRRRPASAASAATASAEPASAEPAGAAAANGEPANGTPVSAEPANGAAANGEPASVEPANGAAANSEPANGTVANSEPANGAPANGAPANGAIQSASAAEVPAAASAANANGSLSAGPVPASLPALPEAQDGAA